MEMVDRRWEVWKEPALKKYGDSIKIGVSLGFTFHGTLMRDETHKLRNRRTSDREE